VRVLTSVTLV